MERLTAEEVEEALMELLDTTSGIDEIVSGNGGAADAFSLHSMFHELLIDSPQEPMTTTSSTSPAPTYSPAVWSQSTSPPPLQPLTQAEMASVIASLPNIPEIADVHVGDEGMQRDDTSSMVSSPGPIRRARATKSKCKRDIKTHRTAVESAKEGVGKAVRDVTMKIMSHTGQHGKHSGSPLAFMQDVTSNFFKRANTGRCNCQKAGWTQCFKEGFCRSECEDCAVCRVGRFVQSEGLVALPYAELCPCSDCVKAGAERNVSFEDNFETIIGLFHRRRFHDKEVCNCKKLKKSDMCLLQQAELSLAALYGDNITI